MKKIGAILQGTWHGVLFSLLAAAGCVWLGLQDRGVAPAIIAYAASMVAVAITVTGAVLRGDRANVMRTPRPVEDRQAAQQAVAGLTDHDRISILLEEWKHVTNVQMHFNEMIIRMRTLAVSVVITVFGAAGFAIASHRDQFIEVFGRDVHVSAFVVTFGIILWLAIYIIDYWYYYKLLVGSVARGNEIDSAFSDARILGTLPLFGSALLISAAIGPRGFSVWVLRIFYGIVYFTGVIFLVAILMLIENDLALSGQLLP